MEHKTRKVGRPRKEETRAQDGGRPAPRVSVGGFRDKLPVRGLSPEYHYRWVLAETDQGNRIAEAKIRGYDFAPSEGHAFGESHVFKTESEGSIVRCPSGKGGDFLYLMRIPKDLYDQQQKEKSKRIFNTEYDAVNQYADSENTEDRGVYGKFELK